jgi:small-conductance mechanosensitive channel
MKLQNNNSVRGLMVKIFNAKFSDAGFRLDLKLSLGYPADILRMRSVIRELVKEKKES